MKMKIKRSIDLSIPLNLAPYVTLFTFFIVMPVVLAALLSLTYFNSVEFPRFVGLANYVNIITQDSVFMKNVLPNTLLFSIIVGPVGYVLQFLLAWALAQVPKRPRMVLALAFYSPSLTLGVTMAIIWKVVFGGDQFGYINYLLLSLQIIEKPVQWLQSPEFILPIMIIVSLWASMGVGFLAMLAGILNIDPELYEAAYIDGLKNRFQEIVYVTVPSMKPQMLFGAVMAIVNAFSAGQIGIDLTGTNPTPQNAGQTLAAHIEDHGFLRYEMGYATALSVVLLLMILVVSNVANRLFVEKD
ncbi:MAG: sugar ABC transporter permease [Clostridiales bacterium]|jgi:multiple sugar transport system permease protein|nr:sugar ABC transporter permease [Clostridiales bacterium]